NTLQYLPNMTVDFADAILDWRGTNGVTSLDYMSTGYAAKNSPFETVDELRLVYGATPALLLGEDLNRNGVLDANEKDLNSNGQLDPGLLEYTTVYTREPNFHSDGTSLTNVNAVTTMTSQTRIVTFLQTFLQAENVGSASTLATKLYQSFSQQGACTGVLDFALRCQAAGMSESDFTKLANDVTINTNTYYFNR